VPIKRHVYDQEVHTVKKFLTAALLMCLLIPVPSASAKLPETDEVLTSLSAQIAQARRTARADISENRAKFEAIPEPTPAPAPVPTPVVASYPAGVLTADQVAGYARGAGFPEALVSTMVSIAYRESRFNPGAINSSSGACGLWQMYPCYGGSAWLDPATNARLAYQKYVAAGYSLSPWGM